MKGENFGRIKPSNLAKFLEESNNSESVYGLMAHDKENMDCISQVGSVARTSASQLAGVSAETKFLLLDMREEDEYFKWHIKEAINFPAPNMHRDKTFAQLLPFKNAADKLIVVYMNDERQGTIYAKALFEKGFDNVYLLTGGIEKFLEACP